MVYEAAGMADSEGDSSFTNDSQSTSLRILNRSSRVMKFDWGVTAPQMPALCIRAMLAPMSGPWRFPVNSTRSGIKSPLPWSQMDTTKDKACQTFTINKFAAKYESLLQLSAKVCIKWFSCNFMIFGIIVQVREVTYSLTEVSDPMVHKVKKHNRRGEKDIIESQQTFLLRALPKPFTHFCQPSRPSASAWVSSPLSYAEIRPKATSEILSCTTGLASSLKNTST